MVWVSQSVKLFFLLLFFSYRQKSHATHKLRGDREKALEQRFQGPFLGGQALITIDPWLSKDDHWLITAYVGYEHDPVYAKACVISSPIAITKLKYFGFGFRTSNSSTLNSKIKSTKGKINDTVDSLLTDTFIRRTPL